jgi:hypothetical protein
MKNLYFKFAFDMKTNKLYLHKQATSLKDFPLKGSKHEIVGTECIKNISIRLPKPMEIFEEEKKSNPRCFVFGLDYGGTDYDIAAASSIERAAENIQRVYQLYYQKRKEYIAKIKDKLYADKCLSDLDRVYLKAITEKPEIIIL